MAKQLLSMAWVFTIRNSMIAFNAGDGVTVTGWDGFVYDNWFSGNGGFGFAGRAPNASITMVGNRVEWNAKGENDETLILKDNVGCLAPKAE